MIVQWISLTCSVIINFMELFMIVTNINSVYIGLTLLACGNSIGGTIFWVTEISSRFGRLRVKARE